MNPNNDRDKKNQNPNQQNQQDKNNPQKQDQSKTMDKDRKEGQSGQHQDGFHKGFQNDKQSQEKTSRDDQKYRP